MFICFEGETKRNVEEKVQRNVIQPEQEKLQNPVVYMYFYSTQATDRFHLPTVILQTIRPCSSLLQSHVLRTPPFFRINRGKSGPLRAGNLVFPIHFDAPLTCIYVLSVYVLGHYKHQRLLDSKTQTSTRTRFDLKLFRVYSQNMDTPESVIGIFFFFFGQKHQHGQFYLMRF